MYVTAEEKLATHVIAVAREWRTCDIPVRAWPGYLRAAERLAKAYLKAPGGEGPRSEDKRD